MAYEKNKDFVAQSTIEAEYVAGASSINQVIRLRKTLLELNLLSK